MRLPSQGCFTALMYLHKYRQRVLAVNHDIDWMLVAACLYVAGKVEEAGASINHLLNTVLQLLSTENASHVMETFPDLAVALTKVNHPKQTHAVLVGDEYYEAKEKLLQAEQLLLRQLHFDLVLDEPYKYLFNFLNSISAPTALSSASVSLLNDAATCSTLCISHPAHLVAAAAITVSAGLLRMTQQLPSSGNRQWWHALDITTDEMDHVSHRLLDLIEGMSQLQSQVLS